MDHIFVVEEDLFNCSVCVVCRMARYAHHEVHERILGRDMSASRLRTSSIACLAFCHESREHLADLTLQCAEVSARQLHDDTQHGLDISHGRQGLVTSTERIDEIDITH